MTLAKNSTDWLWLKLLCLTIIATLTFEHNQFDVRISELFYANGHWLLEKGAQPYAFIFYDFPKLLLILLGIYLITTLTLRFWQSRYSNIKISKPLFVKGITALSSRELSYLLITIIMVPTVIATLKSFTHVSCPNNLSLFNGDLPYLNLWQNIVAMTPAKCFPAAHASAGFSLYGLAFLPTLQKHRYKVFAIVTILGWTMGLYKMLFGDHFFSHTLVSMLLSWTLACALASVLFKKAATKGVTL
ncbi:PAP2 family lipid A phosphatase [Psychrobacter sp. DAB_AL32B]|uniref:PAP2 family lipid A phosphatase n=1 Tax=Psychrobacter sp. DAB_AL32B TaxID=1028414 RepID=UPI000B7F17A2|nr:PAP2 family lipid A phosphatase [Psychrobacter sp. DAB_AL32B]OXL19174.1 phosphoesterase [Psychrobacter sp. DAB_AL32B]